MPKSVTQGWLFNSISVLSDQFCLRGKLNQIIEGIEVISEVYTFTVVQGKTR